VEVLVFFLANTNVVEESRNHPRKTYRAFLDQGCAKRNLSNTALNSLPSTGPSHTLDSVITELVER